jgi:hypothetical protein
MKERRFNRLLIASHHSLRGIGSHEALANGGGFVVGDGSRRAAREPAFDAVEAELPSAVTVEVLPNRVYPQPMAEPMEAEAGGSQRDRSTIKFPYGDLDDATDVATTIHNNFGLSATVDQVAAAMGQSLSGAFRAKMATAGTFGAVESARGSVHLTDLGSRLADPQTEAAAKVEAFLGVELYGAVFERFRGRTLPGDAGLETELVRLGVAQKAAPKARQTLQRSADQAGFFSHGRDRLVQPAVNMMASMPNGASTPVLDPTPPAPAGPSAAAAGGLTQHPLLVGLWQELPDPNTKKLTAEQQANWIETAKLVLKLLYTSSGTATLGVGLTYGEAPGGPGASTDA